MLFLQLGLKISAFLTPKLYFSQEMWLRAACGPVEIWGSAAVSTPSRKREKWHTKMAQPHLKTNNRLWDFDLKHF